MISIVPEGLQKLADALAETFREQILAGIDEQGFPFPRGIDLFRTGALVDSIRGVVLDGTPQIEIRVPYAPFVLSRYHSTSLAPQFAKKLEERWQPILEQYAQYKEASWQ